MLSTVSWFAVKNDDKFSGSTYSSFSELPDGPIKDRPGHGYIFVDARPGEVFTDGLEVLEVMGSTPVVVDSVTLDSGSEGVKLLGAYLAGAERHTGAVEWTHGFPPEGKSFGPLQKAVGATLNPEGDHKFSYELLLGIKITSDSVGRRKGVWVTYHEGNREYAEYLDAQIILCPSNVTEAACAHHYNISL